MRSSAAFSDVSRSEYLLFSIDFVLEFIIRDAVDTVHYSHIIREDDAAEIPCCLAGHTDWVYCANGTPSSALFCSCRRGAKRDSCSSAASHVAAAVKPTNPEFGG